jgi:hypothetical protein
MGQLGLIGCALGSLGLTVRLVCIQNIDSIRGQGTTSAI